MNVIIPHTKQQNIPTQSFQIKVLGVINNLIEKKAVCPSQKKVYGTYSDYTG